jgi:hypothetical protein
MLKKEIHWKGFDGEDVSDVFYFNISMSEVLELEVEAEEPLSDYLQRVVESDNRKDILTAVRRFIDKSYGVRSDDGRSFVKDPIHTAAFRKSLAYDKLIEELLTNEESAQIFMMGIFPTETLKKMGQTKTAELPETPEEKPWANREPTRAELSRMSPEDLREVYLRKAGAPSPEATS